jgi:toxin ParE1/3/4
VKAFRLSRRAFGDLKEIWEFISQDSLDAADRVVDDVYQSFRRLAQTPGMGHKREDLTSRDVLFWPVRSYLVIYTASSPLRIVRVVHGKRDVKKLLRRP